MGVDRITVTLDEQLGRSVRVAAAEAGMSVSAWLSEAAGDMLRNHFLGLALDVWEAEAGPLTEEELAAAERMFNGPLDDMAPEPMPTGSEE